MTTIKSITTKYVSTDIFAGLIEREKCAEFAPYYSTKLVSDMGNFGGTGATEVDAEADAIENFEYAHTLIAEKAVTEYNNRHGIGVL